VGIVAVSVGLPRDVEWQGRTLRTSIFKEPVGGPVRVRTTNLDGDRQSDLSVHGGPDKAVYLYPAEHYPWWRERLGREDLAWGNFGENLTIEGLSEEDLSIGDVLRAGGAELMVTQPRIPCVKLAARLGRADIVRLFLESRRSGFYCSVLTEGDVAAGDGVEVIDRAPLRMSVREMVDLYAAKAPPREAVERALSLRGLAEVWRRELQQKLEQRG
jgi:MOSC domain-containing protein YiiM